MLTKPSKRNLALLIFALAVLSLLVWNFSQRGSKIIGGKRQYLRSSSGLHALSLPDDPRYPHNDPNYPVMPPPTQQDGIQSEKNIPPGLAPIPPEGKSESHALSTPATISHPLPEAAALGLMADPSVNSGVAQSYELPPEARVQVQRTDARPVEAPISSAPMSMGAPPGTWPDEYGVSKTHPIGK